MKKAFLLAALIWLAAFVCVGEGFTLRETADLPLLSAEVRLYEHELTGAQVIIIRNDDKNLTFDVSFVTPVTDNSGIAHVFEHATLEGSAKYPSRRLFFNLNYRTYNTYMNAMTLEGATVYPVSSFDERQLLAYADFYLDCCFEPLLLTDENIFNEEAWRYSLTDAESPLVLTGTVYNEMKGADSIANAARYNFLKTLCGTGFVSGGVPEEIAALSWDDLKAYHEKYYKPENCLVLIYGDIQNEQLFFELLDGYFIGFAGGESAHLPAVEESRGYISDQFEYPAYSGTPTVDASEIYYGFMCRGADPEYVELLARLLNEGSGEMCTTLSAAIPGGAFFCSCEYQGGEPVLIFRAAGVDRDDAPVFKNTVDSVLRHIASAGFEKLSAETVITALELGACVSSEITGRGTDIAPQIALRAAWTGDALAGIRHLNAISEYGDYLTKGYPLRIINKYLLSNPVSALTVTYPVAGLRNEADAQLEAELALVKAGLTQREISTIVKREHAGITDDSASYIEQLSVVKVSELAETVNDCEVTETRLDCGAHRLEAVADTEGAVAHQLFFAADMLTLKELQYLKLYTDMLGSFPTENRSVYEIRALRNRYLYGLETGIGVNCDVPYLFAGWIGRPDDTDKGYEALDELLFKTAFADDKALSVFVGNLKGIYANAAAENSSALQIYRAAAWNAGGAVMNALYGEGYIAFLEETSKLESDELTENIEAARRAVFGAEGAVSCAAGREEDIKADAMAAQKLLEGLPETEKTEKAEYSALEIPSSEAFVTGSSVCDNLIYLPVEKVSGGIHAVTALVSDRLLYPVLRTEYGAYSVAHAYEDGGVYVLTVNDPATGQTLDYYRSLGTQYALLCGQVTQYELDGYILGAYSAFVNCESGLMRALTALENTFAGYTPEDALSEMRELKALRADELESYTYIYEALSEGYISTSGPRVEIDKNADLYENVIAVFDGEAAYGGAQENAWYTPYVNDAMIYGFMPPLDGGFEAEKAATGSDIALAFSIILGGEKDRDSAFRQIKGYGLVEGRADDALTREAALYDMYRFCHKLGLDTGKSALSDYPDRGSIGKGMEKVWGWGIAKGYIRERDGKLEPGQYITRGELAVMIMSVYYGR